MPQISFNLSSLLCLDYTLDVFQLTQAPLINNITHNQASILLTNFCMASNAMKKLLQQAQLDADELDEIMQQQQVEVPLKEARTQNEQDNLCKDK